jgi:hypothetical protein
MSDGQEIINDSNSLPESTELSEKKELAQEMKKKSFNFDFPIILASFSSLLLLLILILHFPSKPKPINWEYKTLKFYSQGYDRTGSEAGKFASIMVSEEKLNELGTDGWELVSSALEMETSYPNFGNPSYVTGLQPNVRPQALICIFKKPMHK